MEVITAIITALSGLLGVGKNFLELRVTLMSLFRKEVQLNKAFAGLSKSEEKVLIDLYKAIEIGKELTSRIYKQLLIKYLVSLSITLLLIIAGVVFIQSLFVFKVLQIFILPLAGYFIITKLLPVPLKISSFKPDGKLGEVFQNLNLIRRNIDSKIEARIYKFRRTFGTLNGITFTEQMYLQHYLDLCSLRDTIEMYWIDKKIEDVKTFVFETTNFRQTFENTLSDTIEGVLINDEDVHTNVDKITNDIKSHGLDRFLLLLDDRFFKRDFKKEYQVAGKDGIKKVIREYW